MEDLVKGLMAGKSGAFDEFVQVFGDRLFRFVRRLVGAGRADDVTQEVFLRVHRSLGRYESTGSFSAWVYTLANNVCIDFLRKRKHPDRDVPPDQPGPKQDPAESMNAVELREAILLAVERLPVEQKQVFLLREEGGLTFREIADLLGCPLNTALGRMHYALKTLRKSLAAYK